MITIKNVLGLSFLVKVDKLKKVDWTSNESRKDASHEFLGDYYQTKTYVFANDEPVSSMEITMAHVT